MNDLSIFFQWYGILLILGLSVYPITAFLFSSFFDKGYIFSKVIAVLIISYLMFLFGTLHIFPFSQLSLSVLLIMLFVVNIFIFKRTKKKILNKSSVLLIIVEELLFFISLAIWTYIRAHEPSINGLEKFMDYGFINSILRSEYFPPTDIWFPPFPINYYYFGHLITAVLTKLSSLPSQYTYNLMVATLFAFTFVGSFSIGYNLIKSLKFSKTRSIIAGIVSGMLVAVAGNMQTIYAFFTAYTPPDNPVPLWQLAFKPFDLFTSNGYWYPNATRFIPNTIHEFPIYSFVVSDLHGHVLDIPVVLTFIAFLLSIFLNYYSSTDKQTKLPKQSKNILMRPLFKSTKWNFRMIHILVISFFLSVMYMTNVLDFGIYFLLCILVLGFLLFSLYKKDRKERFREIILSGKFITQCIKIFGTIGVTSFIFSLPFSIHFKPFASGIGILCAPDILTQKGKIGPFLFEANHCQRSEWWMLLTLYAFFYFFVAILGIYIWKHYRTKIKATFIFCVLLTGLSTLLIIIPEFVYIKDIYPDHYRANTMFKLTYQAFIMLSLVSAFVISAIVIPTKKIVVSGITIILLSIVFLYPRFAIYSYYNSLTTYIGIDGTAYLKTRYPYDYEAIQWINNNITGQPVILESQGDSYTDHERISANTGLPTVLGWTVHEWLWRGSYDIPAPRIPDVQTLYETSNIEQARALLKKYNVQYVYIGNMEKDKYPNLSQTKFSYLGGVVYQNKYVTIYKIAPNFGEDL